MTPSPSLRKSSPTRVTTAEVVVKFGLRPSDVSNEVRVRNEFLGWGISGNANQRHLKSSSAGILHRGKAVGVICNEREKIYLAIRAVVRHIQPDAHVNTLLFELRREVRIGQWARSDRDVFGCPSFELEHATSHSKEFF